MLNWIREYNRTVSYHHTQLMVIFMHEGWSTSCHFVNQDTKGPPINTESMAFHVKNLWSKILSSSTERISLIFISIQEFREAEIS